VPTFTILTPGKPERRETLDLPILKVGRDERSHLRVDDAEVARMHAVIEVGEDGTLTLIDLGSSGTFVNEQRINKAVLRAGDRVRMGRSTIVVDGSAAREALFLPKPDVVRAKLGAAFTPSDIFGVAAFVLHVDGIRREAWSDKTEIAERLFETYPRGTPPPAELSEISGPLSRNFKTIDDTAGTRVTRCSTCIVRPGFAPCSVCLGTGAGSRGDADDRCFACIGEGFLPCTACDGTTRVVACTIRYVNDVYVRVRRAIVPTVHASIRSYLEARIPADAPWPKEHAFDPEPSMIASAYRGASAVRAPEEFHGFFFGDAIANTLAARAELTTGLARFESSTYAVPILWTVTGEKHDAYFFDASGALQHVG
jgi:hypothetical protein